MTRWPRRCAKPRSAQLPQSDQRRGVRGIEFVDAAFGAVRVAGKIYEQVAQQTRPPQ